MFFSNLIVFVCLIPGISAHVANVDIQGVQLLDHERTLYLGCTPKEWTGWSACSNTCGGGFRVRALYYEGSGNCEKRHPFIQASVCAIHECAEGVKRTETPFADLIKSTQKDLLKQIEAADVQSKADAAKLEETKKEFETQKRALEDELVKAKVEAEAHAKGLIDSIKREVVVQQAPINLCG